MTETQTQQHLEKLMADRRAKLDALRDRGLDPFPSRYRVQTSVSDVRAAFDALTTEELEIRSEAVRLAGRLRAVRRQGKVIFADISDG